MQGGIAIRALCDYLMEGITPASSIGVIPQLIMNSNLDLYMKKAWNIGRTSG